jgi:transmembrane sensor
MVIVAVDHGRVQVETKISSGNAEMTPVILSDGQMAEVSPNTSPVFLERNAMDAFGFSSGKLVFENASLNEVAETLSRYRLKPIIAIGKNSKQPHITAVMNVAETESFLKTLPQIAAVEVKQNQNQTLLISKKISRQK